MTFRTRLLLVFAVTILAAVGMVVWIVSHAAERAFGRLDQQRTAALVDQFYKEFELRGTEIAAAAGFTGAA
jgi:type IV secretory pathway TrbD component